MIGNFKIKNIENRQRKNSLSKFGQNENKSKLQTLKSKIQHGYSLLELVIAMFILILLISVAVPTYFHSIQHARETVLKETLFQMRKVIQQYTADKGKMPKGVQDLVDSGYFREMPVDPVTNKSEWDAVLDEDPNDPDGGQGLRDVKSLAEGEDSTGEPYNKY